jgi:hypothetical protein
MNLKLVINIFFTQLLVLSTLFIYGQVPQAFSFQGIALDAQSLPHKDKDLNIEIKILQGSTTGQIQYRELHKVKTNANGLYSLSIGRGTPQAGQFINVNWSNLPLFISVGIDDKLGSNYVLAGITELLSVPYALRAGESNIEPKIYAKAVNPNPLVMGSDGRFVSNFGFWFHYEWIHGQPENVFVDYLGLPDNLLLVTNARDGYSVTDIRNESKTDTIIDGILEPQTRIERKNASQKIAGGKYNPVLRFRTKNKILDSLKFSLEVVGITYEQCVPGPFPYRATLSSNSCPEIDSFLQKELILKEGSSSQTMQVPSLFNQSKFIEVNFTSGNCQFFSGNDYFFRAGTSYITNLKSISKTQIQFNIIVDNLNLKECLVTYK